MLAHAAGHDGVVMRKIRLDIQRDAVKGDPAPEPHPDRRDLRLRRRATRPQRAFRSDHPDADAAGPPLALHAEFADGADHPFLKIMDIGANVPPTSADIEHGVGDALTRSMIGELAAATGPVHRKSVGNEKIRLSRAGSRRDQRRMLKEPNAFRGLAGMNRRHPRLLPGESHPVAHRSVADPPFDHGAK